MKSRTGKTIKLTIDNQSLDWRKIDTSAACSVLEYVRWMAEIDPDFQMSVGEVWHFYQQGRDVGVYPSEITDELGLAEYPDW